MWKRLSGYERAILVCTVAMLAIAIVAWAEQSRWLAALLSVIATTIPVVAVFMMLVALGFLLGLSMLHRLRETVTDLKSTTDRLVGFVTGEAGLGHANVQLGLHEARLDNLNASLLDRIAADIATDRRVFTRDQIKALSPIDQAALFKRHPKVLEWYVELGGASKRL